MSEPTREELTAELDKAHEIVREHLMSMNYQNVGIECIAAAITTLGMDLMYTVTDPKDRIKAEEAIDNIHLSARRQLGLLYRRV